MLCAAVEIVQYLVDRTRLQSNTPRDQAGDVDGTAIREVEQLDQLRTRVIGDADDVAFGGQDVAIGIDGQLAQVDGYDHDPAAAGQRTEGLQRRRGVAGEIEDDVDVAEL